MGKVEDLIVRWKVAWEGTTDEDPAPGSHQDPAVAFLDTLTGDTYPFDCVEARVDAVQLLLTSYNERGYALVGGLERLRAASTGWLWFQRNSP